MTSEDRRRVAVAGFLLAVERGDFDDVEQFLAIVFDVAHSGGER